MIYVGTVYHFDNLSFTVKSNDGTKISYTSKGLCGATDLISPIGPFEYMVERAKKIDIPKHILVKNFIDELDHLEKSKI